MICRTLIVTTITSLNILLSTTPLQATDEVTTVFKIFQEADELERKKDFGKAISLYEKVIKEYPETKYEDEISSGKYSDLARDRIRVLTCFRKRGPDFSTDTPQQLASLIKEALMKKDAKKLAKLASCDFTVGPANSDNTWSLLPQEVAPVIIQNSENFNLKLSRTQQMLDAWWDFEVSDMNQTDRHSFNLKKRENKWLWMGYATSRSSVLDSLLQAHP